jgi:hypothetical protein
MRLAHPKKKVKITIIEYEFENFQGNVDAVIKGDIIMPEEAFKMPYCI